MLLGERLAGNDQRRRAVGRGANVKQPKRIRHHRTGQHVLDRALLAVPGVRIVQPVLGVLDLHRGEVLERGAVEIHPPPRQQREVHRVRRTDQMEALPVGIVLALAADRGEEALRRGVGADHQRHVAESGEDLGPGALQGLRAAGARSVAGADRDAVPAKLLGERRTRDEAGVAVADRVGACDQLDLAPVQARLGQCGPGGDHAVLGEVTAPLAPRVHARAEDVDGAWAGCRRRCGSVTHAILQA